MNGYCQEKHSPYSTFIEVTKKENLVGEEKKFMIMKKWKLLK
jgi:hypothetical protein